MRLILVRHGEAHAGFHGVIAGEKGCSGLTALGRRQAEALRDHLAASGRIEANVLIASRIPRAIETAELIAPGLGLEIASRDCDLCEVHTGIADGMPWADFKDRYETFDMETEPDREFAPEAESWNGFHVRVQGALDRLARTYQGQTVVAVCHAGVIMASMRLLLGVPLGRADAQLRPSNTGLTEWAHDGLLEQWTLHTFNEAIHLLDVTAPD